MRADRSTALIDACVLAGALKRNLLLTLAEAELFQPRWSKAILDETERAIARMLARKSVTDASDRAARALRAMTRAFPEAAVQAHEALSAVVPLLPDRDDEHVLAAAMKTRASVIVTDNLKHFPNAVLAPLGIEVITADAFIADTITLDTGRAVAAIRRMRERFKRPEKTPEVILLDMRTNGLTETAHSLAPLRASL